MYCHVRIVIAVFGLIALVPQSSRATSYELNFIHRISAADFRHEHHFFTLSSFPRPVWVIDKSFSEPFSLSAGDDLSIHIEFADGESLTLLDNIHDEERLEQFMFIVESADRESGSELSSWFWQLEDTSGDLRADVLVNQVTANVTDSRGTFGSFSFGFTVEEVYGSGDAMLVDRFSVGFVPVPEPGVAASLVGILGMLAWRRRGRWTSIR